MSEFIGMCGSCRGDVILTTNDDPLSPSYICSGCGKLFDSKEEFGTLSPEAKEIIDNHSRVWSNTLAQISVWIASCQSSEVVNSKMLNEAYRLMELIEKNRRNV